MKLTAGRLNYLCLAAFAIAFTSLLLSDLLSFSDVDNGYFAVPAPGLESVADYRASKPGNYEMWAEIPSLIPKSVGLPDNLPPIPCDFEISATSPSGPSVVVRSRLRLAAEYPYGRVYVYGSDPFALDKGAYSIKVKNIGCDKGYFFQGGMAHLHLPEPVRIPLPSFWQWLTFISACTGFGGLLVQAGRRSLRAPDKA
jgi:hypothetical protein